MGARGSTWEPRACCPHVYAHRGRHFNVDEENRIPAFRRALRRFNGFECDIRLSRDGIPVVIHDATLRRTHDDVRRVCKLNANELQRLGVPTLAEALLLLVTHRTARIIIDIKVNERALLLQTLLLARGLGVREDNITFLVWHALCARPSTTATILRAVDNVFESSYTHTDGVACKYSGDAQNQRCIETALGRAQIVNMWTPDDTLSREMIDTYRLRAGCTFTVGH